MSMIPLSIFLLWVIPFMMSNEKIEQGYRIGFIAIIVLIFGLQAVFNFLLG